MLFHFSSPADSCSKKNKIQINKKRKKSKGEEGIKEEELKSGKRKERKKNTKIITSDFPQYRCKICNSVISYSKTK